MDPRFERQVRLLGEDGQRRLHEGRVLVVGVGGLGCPAALHLAAMGVGRLGLVDPDAVEASNLHRQVLYGPGDVGRWKVEAARARLAELAPATRVEMHRQLLGPGNAARLVAGHDVVLDGTDDPGARPVLEAACRRAGVPLVHAALHGHEAQLTVLVPDGPCLRCLCPATDAPGCDAVLGAMAGAVGALQALEAVKLLAGVGAPTTGRVLLIDGLTGRFEEVRHVRRQGCLGCAPEPAGLAPADAPAGAPAERVDRDTFLRLHAAGCPVVDVREAHEVAAHRLPGSIHIPLDRLPDRLDDVPRDQIVLVHCEHGQRSLAAARLLRSRGCDARSLQGGLAALRQEA